MNEITFSKRVLYVLIAAIPYFAWFGGFVGMRSEHIGLFVLCAAFFLANESLRKALAGSFAFIIFWMIYDSLRVCPNYTVNAVNIAEPYLFDKKWFGINTAEGRLTLNEYFVSRTTPFWDVVTAIFYLTWVPVPFVFAVWLWFKDRELFVRYSYGYLLCNLIGFTLYYLYPAAPPWYVELNGFEFNPNTARSAAGLDNFDKMFNTQLFHKIYSRNSNVFAAIPSLHSAYPLISLFYARKAKAIWPKAVFSILCIGIWCSAIYLRHHYVIDVLIGILVAVAAYYLFEFLISRTRAKVWYAQLVSWLVGSPKA